MIIRLALLTLATLSATWSSNSVNAQATRPNVVWILSEDNSKHYLRLYGDPLAPTPTIEAMARDGLVFEHAFSCAPVCSVARTTLMTGILAPRVGFQFHRKYEPAGLPQGAAMFTSYLRQAGYYCTNNAKTDYNVDVNLKDVWDESSRRASWRNRPSEDTPFFHMQTFTVSHESSLHFNKQTMQTEQLTTDPSAVRIAAYHPDTPTFRHTYARYHDRIRAVDDAVAGVLAELKSDGLWDTTFVFYFGDHGGVLPRSKGYLYESGLHVPLVIRVPEAFRHLCPWDSGDRPQGFVNFTDFGPTVLGLAGIDTPATMDGRPFLGRGVAAEEVESRNEAFGYADRFDEKYDLCRCLRIGDFKYIRNYEAFYPDALQNNYRYLMLAYQEWRTMFQQGKLDDAQKQFFEAKPVEALYDLSQDPDEVRNLAGDPKFEQQLKTMRSRLQERVKSLADLSFFPESFLIEHALEDGAAFGQKNRERIAGLIDTADLALLPWDDARPRIVDALQDQDAWRRYWAVTVCSCFGEQARSLADNVRGLLDDAEPLVRARAAEFLGSIGAADPRPVIREVLATLDSAPAATIVLNMAVYLQDGPRAYDFQLTRADVKATGDGVTRRLEYLSGAKPERRNRKAKKN